MLFWSWFLLQAALPPDPPAVTVAATPTACPTPPQYTYTEWNQYWDERWFDEKWVTQRLHYSRTAADECRGTSVTEVREEGPNRLWRSVPANRVADVSTPEGPVTGVSGSALRSSDLPRGGAPAEAGPNPDPVVGITAGGARGRQPGPVPNFLGMALLAGALVGAVMSRRRPGKRAPSSERIEEPREPHIVRRPEARTLDSIQEKTEWVPTAAEVEWLQAFFGIEEDGYGPLTQEAVDKLQRKYQIRTDDQRGVNTYRALWKEHKDLIHQWWQNRAERGEPLDLERLFASPMPPDLRAELENLNQEYAGYWVAVEGRYQAILRRDQALVDDYQEQIEAYRRGVIKFHDIPALKAKYQPAIDALYEQAEKVVKDADDGDYAKLLAMLDAADKGNWNDIATARATLGGRWDALWSRDASERSKAAHVVEFLHPHEADSVLAGVVDADMGASAVPNVQNPTEMVFVNADEPQKTTQAGDFDDAFWKEVGPSPVVNSDTGKAFASHFESWVVELNGMVKACWAERTTDHAGTPTDNLYETYKLTPEKVEKLWAVARDNNVDPRLLLAILVQEGTGSFDTNSVSSDYYEGNGPQPDWDEDLKGAFNSLILAKLRLYPAAVKGGFTGDWVDYVNWYTPIDRLNKKGVAGESGVFAEDIYWADGVRQTYLNVVKNTNPRSSSDPVQTYSAWMGAHPELFQPKFVKGEFRIEQGLPQSVKKWPTAATHPIHYDPNKHPGAKMGTDGFYHFPAPDYYVWRLVPVE